MPRRLLALALLVPILTGWSVGAQDPAKTKTDKPAEVKEHLVETKHSLALAGGKLDYVATAGTLTLKEEDGKPLASMFFVAYTKGEADDARRRPVSFAFNGGPGSSSVWLHMGALGPRRVQLPERKSVAPPFRLLDNESTLLDATDLVFIDPVSTGYSRPAPGQPGDKFHGVQQDVQTVGEFIRLYVTRYKRWDSPKFLIGESYGTTRAANLVNYLQDHDRMNFNGVVLISAVLNFQTLRFDEGNDLPYIVFLPTYTSTAWYHKKLSADLQADRKQALEEAEKFALGEYAGALMKGDSLSAEEHDAVAKKLARYTGLTEDYVKRSNLRIESSRFNKELLRPERRTVGRFDSRLIGIDLDAVGESPDYDPSLTDVEGPYSATLNNYLRSELKYETETPYRILTNRVQPWDYGTAKNRYLNVSPALRKAMTTNPGLRVFVANGWYDLATPYFATQYTFNHLGLDPAYRDHVRMSYYDGGHMMYTEPASLQKLKKDLVGFYEASVPR